MFLLCWYIGCVGLLAVRAGLAVMVFHFDQVDVDCKCECLAVGKFYFFAVLLRCLAVLARFLLVLVHFVW